MHVMKKLLTSSSFLILLSAFVFYVFFYDNTAGLNVLLITFYGFALYVQLKKRNGGTIFKLLLAGSFVLSLAVLVAHTAWSISVFWICFVCLLGNFAYTDLKHLQYSPALFFESFRKLFPALLRHFTPARVKRKVSYASYFRFILLPVLVLVTIFTLYGAASEPFRLSMNSLWQYFTDIFSRISFSRIFFFLLGVMVFGLCFTEITFSRVINADAALQYRLVRKRRRTNLLSLSRMLLRRKQVAIVLFALLNVMIFWLNYLDISHTWFGFKWDGGYLKEFVHEGTYLLIVAIVLSIATAVYYLNSNLVFFKNNKLFNALVIGWLLQNAVMIVSVAIRNSYYIDYFALAYLRIFVYFFLAACAVGIGTVILMIWRKKSTGYLVSVNSISVFVIVIVSCCFNWDAIIARYNFTHYKESFVHLEFLAGLNDSALPYMNYTEEQIKQISAVQYSRFSFASSEMYTKIDFAEAIKQRKEAFKKRWEQHNLFEWNYPEQKAYNILFPG
jgi:hypothetical protein